MRTPLNGILGITELALHTDDIEKIRGYLQKIMTAGSLLKDLINDTLELSRIGNGKKQLDYEVVEASSMLEHLITSIRPAAEQSGVNFHVDLSFAELGFVRMDRLKLSKVLLNLLSNAVKFTPKGGDVWLLGEVLSCDEHEAVCRFTVRDNGVGMSKEFLPRMFTPFEQENALSVQGTQGTGLGLSIARELLMILGGTIAVESEKGKGTTFTVEVRFERAKRNDGQKAAVPPICLDRRQILVCEDNELNREIVTTLLEMNNLQVIQAENGEQGVQCFIESPEYSIEAILMDIRMPVMDGLTAAAKIRQLARRDAARVPIIALSANAFQEDVEASRRVGMNAHLTKPIEPDLLINCLQSQIGMYEAQRKGE